MHKISEAKIIKAIKHMEAERLKVKVIVKFKYIF